MSTKRTLFVLATPEYEPELCEITFPYLKRYADKIGAEFHRISERKYPDFPVTYERLQIHTLGAGNEWNLCIDPDILVHPDTDDFTQWFPKTHIGNWFFFDVRQHFNVTTNPYFIRDGRFYGIVDCLVASSNLTHDIWTPLDGSFSQFEPMIYDKEWLRRISEFTLSQNIARYGMKVQGMVRNGKNLFHIECSSNMVKKPADCAIEKLRAWGLR